MDGPRIGIDTVVPYAPPTRNGEAKDGDALYNVRALRLTVNELLAPVEPEEYLLPGLIPTESYTLIAGALSTFKSTLLIYLGLWRATGVDLLNLDPVGSGCDVGPVLLTFYEDSDRRMTSRVRRIVQAAHEDIRQQHGAKFASTFLNNVERNLLRAPLTGQAGATIVYRTERGLVLPNSGMIQSLIGAARGISQSDLMIAIDPLRLAITGSQNDDDIGAVVVHALNLIANSLPRSGLVVVSHTTKSEAKDPAEGYAGAAYATAGSALYSQHARSNFLLTRIRPEAARTLVTDPSTIRHEPIARLTHGRLSHGRESAERFVQMRNGILIPLEPRPELAPMARMMEFGKVVARALERLGLAGVQTSATALRGDPEIKDYAADREIRTLLTLLEENGYIEFTGKTKDRSGRLTPKGLAAFATKQHESRRDQ